MDGGRLVAAGPVASVIDASSDTTGGPVIVHVDDPSAAVQLVYRLDGVFDVLETAQGFSATLNGMSRGELIRALVEAGLDVDKVIVPRGLEQAFLELVGERA